MRNPFEVSHSAIPFRCSPTRHRNVRQEACPQSVQSRENVHSSGSLRGAALCNHCCTMPPSISGRHQRRAFFRTMHKPRLFRASHRTNSLECRTNKHARPSRDDPHPEIREPTICARIAQMSSDFKPATDAELDEERHLSRTDQSFPEPVDSSRRHVIVCMARCRPAYFRIIDHESAAAFSAI